MRALFGHVTWRRGVMERFSFLERGDVASWNASLSIKLPQVPPRHIGRRLDSEHP